MEQETNAIVVNNEYDMSRRTTSKNAVNNRENPLRAPQQLLRQPLLHQHPPRVARSRPAPVHYPPP